VDRSEDENKPIPVSQPYVWALAITCIGVVLMGTIFADPIFNWAMQAAKGLFS